jgi:hypothetical protein
MRVRQCKLQSIPTAPPLVRHLAMWGKNRGNTGDVTATSPFDAGLCYCAHTVLAHLASLDNGYATPVQIWPHDPGWMAFAATLVDGTNHPRERFPPRASSRGSKFTTWRPGSRDPQNRNGLPVALLRLGFASPTRGWVSVSC